jgi:hypothetical protein
MNTKKQRRKIVFGVLNRVALYKKAREGGKGTHNVAVMKDIDRKLVWRMRTVSNADQ